MDKLLQTTSVTLDNYFNVLHKVGYLNDTKVNQVLLLTYLNDMLQDCRFFITAEDYTTIASVLSCLMTDSCLVPYSEFIELTEPSEYYINNLQLRVSEEFERRKVIEDNTHRLPS